MIILSWFPVSIFLYRILLYPNNLKSLNYILTWCTTVLKDGSVEQERFRRIFTHSKSLILSEVSLLYYKIIRGCDDCTIGQRTLLTRARGYKTFFMLNWAQNEICCAYKKLKTIFFFFFIFFSTQSWLWNSDVCDAIQDSDQSAHAQIDRSHHGLRWPQRFFRTESHCPSVHPRYYFSRHDYLG